MLKNATIASSNTEKIQNLKAIPTEAIQLQNLSQKSNSQEYIQKWFKGSRDRGLRWTSYLKSTKQEIFILIPGNEYSKKRQSN